MVHFRGGKVAQTMRLDEICLEDPNAPPEQPLPLPTYVFMGSPTAPLSGSAGGIDPAVNNRQVLTTRAPQGPGVTSQVFDEQPANVQQPLASERVEQFQDPRAHVVSRS